jgi:hypothetical protein
MAGTAGFVHRERGDPVSDGRVVSRDIGNTVSRDIGDR